MLTLCTLKAVKTPMSKYAMIGKTSIKRYTKHQSKDIQLILDTVM